MSAEATSILNHLAAIPRDGNATCERKVLREIMLQTGGWMFAHGRQYDIQSKHLGAGVYRLSLKARA